MRTQLYAIWEAEGPLVAHGAQFPDETFLVYWLPVAGHGLAIEAVPIRAFLTRGQFHQVHQGYESRPVEGGFIDS